MGIANRSVICSTQAMKRKKKGNDKIHIQAIILDFKLPHFQKGSYRMKLIKRDIK